ncbi:site-2 protease family protein [Qipengyuania huizhouensis]|jgi:Zn-dependent protease|uniref:site-2 protease family protein n=1 Tax=Qipengyuania huizhouensis TaxID=2867245 RepID=UPI0017E25C90|nr:site-2 protease family protein [Qipengyuania huizhouensis]MBA4764101.1 site-2 protease family protein [Erythrobacter sp.]MBX7460765.1 site-2 protease family protein [Qipengyuania huizhouensis]
MAETLTLAAVLIPCLIIAIVFHEVAHGWTALALGDTTARDMGRLTLNPIKHVDPIGTLLVPGALALFGGPIFGWAKPVPVNARRLDNPRYGMMAVAAAGPGTNILLALLGAIIFGMLAGFATTWGVALSDWALTAFGSFIVINVFLALFNMLPIPPFDGSHIVGGLMPRRWAHHWQKLQAMGMLLLVVLIAATWAFPDARWIENTIFPPVEWLTGLFYSVAAGIEDFIT